MKATEREFNAVIVAKASCVLVIALMLASLVYVAITAFTQYGTIGV